MTRGRPAIRKRKADGKEEDPWLSKMSLMWNSALEKQEERFARLTELQEKAIAVQTEQTKHLVGGLKDLIKEVMK